MTGLVPRGREIRSLTGLRGIAALWVVVHHALFIPSPEGLLWTLIHNGYLAVDLFFVLSGYVMALTYAGWFEKGICLVDVFKFLRKRFARTYPLYAAATFITGLIMYYFEIHPWASPRQICGAAAMLPNMLLVQMWNTPFCSVDTPGWSISVEWGAYLLFPLLCQFTIFGTKRCVGAAAALSLLSLLIISMIPKNALGQPGGPWGPLDIAQGLTLAPAIRCMAGFTLGLVAHRLSRSKSGVAVGGNGLASLLLTCALLIVLCVSGTDLVAVCLFPLLILSLSQDRGMVSRMLGSRTVYFLGEISYSIYLVHYPILRLIQQVPFPSDGMLWPTVVTLSFTIAVSVFTYYLVERPARRALGGKFSRVVTRSEAGV